MRKVMLVGGQPNLNSKFRRKLQAFADVEWTVGGNLHQPPAMQALPSDCTAVVSMHTTTSAAVSNRMEELAVKAGVPYVRVDAKWSHAMPVLERAGILSPVVAGQGSDSRPWYSYTEMMLKLRCASSSTVHRFAEVHDIPDKQQDGRRFFSADHVDAVLARDLLPPMEAAPTVDDGPASEAEAPAAPTAKEPVHRAWDVAVLLGMTEGHLLALCAREAITVTDSTIRDADLNRLLELAEPVPTSPAISPGVMGALERAIEQEVRSRMEGVTKELAECKVSLGELAREVERYRGILAGVRQLIN